MQSSNNFNLRESVFISQLGLRFLTSPLHSYSLLWLGGLLVVFRTRKDGAVPLFLPMQEIDDLLVAALTPDGGML
jgi:hypothetical protein